MTADGLENTLLSISVTSMMTQGTELLTTLLKRKVFSLILKVERVVEGGRGCQCSAPEHEEGLAIRSTSTTTI